MRTTRPNSQQAFRGAPQHRLGIVGKVAKWVGISLGASVIATIIVAICSADMLGVLFVALKLSHNIAWSWILVLSPFIAQAVVGVVVLTVVIVLVIKEMR